MKPVSGGSEVPLGNVPTVSYADSWMATNTGVYYTDSSSRPISLNFYEFASRTTRKLMILQQHPAPGGLAITVPPDGRWLLYLCYLPSVFGADHRPQGAPGLISPS
jgi:hypothetical protein